MVAAVRGYKLILVMPESMSMERASLLSSYGAQLVLTAAWEGMKGSIKEAESIVAQNPPTICPTNSLIRRIQTYTEKRPDRKLWKRSMEESMHSSLPWEPAAPSPDVAR